MNKGSIGKLIKLVMHHKPTPVDPLKLTSDKRKRQAQATSASVCCKTNYGKYEKGYAFKFYPLDY